jgi:hypothetical protein
VIGLLGTMFEQILCNKWISWFTVGTRCAGRQGGFRYLLEGVCKCNFFFLHLDALEAAPRDIALHGPDNHSIHVSLLGPTITKTCSKKLLLAALKV